jgi:beta-glucosidase
MVTIGAVTTKPIDAGAQENGRLAQWSGQGSGELSFIRSAQPLDLTRSLTNGVPTDLSRQTTGDLAILFRYRLAAAPAAPVKLSVTCGPGCGAALDVTSLLTSSADDQWHVTKIKLTCFRTAGADMSKVEKPFVLSTSGKLDLGFTEVRLTTNEGDAICPGGR